MESARKIILAYTCSDDEQECKTAIEIFQKLKRDIAKVEYKKTETNFSYLFKHDASKIDKIYIYGLKTLGYKNKTFIKNIQRCLMLGIEIEDLKSGCNINSDNFDLKKIFSFLNKNIIEKDYNKIKTKRTRKRKVNPKIKECINLIKSGVSMIELSKMYGVSRQSIYNWVKNYEALEK